jgi:hypothetical protein
MAILWKKLHDFKSDYPFHEMENFIKWIRRLKIVYILNEKQNFGLKCKINNIIWNIKCITNDVYYKHR